MLCLWVFADVSDDLRAFKTPSNMHLTTECHIAVDCDCENIKSYLLIAYLLAYLFTCLLTCLLAYLLAYLLVYLLVYLFTCLLACLLAYLLAYLFTCLPA
jgi:hypothetical protein